MGVILQNMTREQMGALALPLRVYRCEWCGIEYQHDDARHHYFECAVRLNTEEGRGGR